jgi:leader peptidase (prepilin peptidase) / N-methyltransferase
MTYVFAVLMAGLGWLIGAFVNYIADVLPVTRGFTPTLCHACQAPIRAIDYLLMRRCRACGKPRRVRAWLVQILSVVITVVMFLYPPVRTGFWIGMMLLTYFAVVTVIDFENHLILHPTSIVGAVLCAAVGVWRHGWLSTLYGMLAGAGVMIAFYLFGILFVKVVNRSRVEKLEEGGMGQGDVILSGVLGLLLGWPGIWAGLTFAVLIAGAVSVLILLSKMVTKKYEAYQYIAYGPYLVLGAIVALFWR